MFVMLFVLIVIAYLTALPAWYFGKSRVHWYRSDYGVPVYGFSVWVLLAMMGIGATPSLSNFVVEIFWIFVMTVLSPWLRLIWPGENDQLSKASSRASIIFVLVVAVVLRLTTPTLPE